MSFFPIAAEIVGPLRAKDRAAFEAIDAGFAGHKHSAPVDLHTEASSSDSSHIDAYDAGVFAALDGKAYANPYPDGSDEAQSFSDGWNDQSRINADDHRLRMIEKGRAA